MTRTSLTLAAMLSIMPATIAHAQFGSGLPNGHSRGVQRRQLDWDSESPGFQGRQARRC
jgi:hypothetical protein